MPAVVTGKSCLARRQYIGMMAGEQVKVAISKERLDKAVRPRRVRSPDKVGIYIEVKPFGGDLLTGAQGQEGYNFVVAYQAAAMRLDLGISITKSPRTWCGASCRL